MPYEGFNSRLDKWAGPGKCNWTRGVVVDRAKKVMTREIFDRIVELSDPARPFRVSLCFEYMSQDKVNSVPSDETAYARNRPGLGNGIAFINWNGRKPELEGEARHILEEVTGMVHVNGLRYGNYGADTEASKDSDRRKRAQELYRENYPRLQELKRQYDPEMIFDKWFVIHPAAPTNGERKDENGSNRS